MLERDFQRSIRKAGEFLKELGFLRSLRNPSSLSISKEFNSVALSTLVKHDSVYFRALELNYYNILLSDYSLFQFSLISEGARPELRLCFIPNPSTVIDYEPTESINDIRLFESMFRSGEIDFEEFSQALSELDYYFSIPIVRVDASYTQFVKIHHPAVHMHVGLNNPSRIALDRVWSPFMFTLFVVKNFYCDLWHAKTGESFRLEKLAKEEKDQLALLEDKYFCPVQKGLINLL